MAEFPEEIITQILSLLPVISLLRFKSVCKSWYSLIKSPKFINLHLRQTRISDSNRHVLLYGPNLYYADLNLDHRRNDDLAFSELLEPTGAAVNFLGTCNGVICIANSTLFNISLYNPLTRSHLNVPKLSVPKLSNIVVLFGFGYDSTSDDYKVLRVVQGHDIDFRRGVVVREQASVFSVKTCSWKPIQGIGYRIISTSKDRFGCLVNGVLHYIVYKNDTNMWDNSGMQRCIACFDLRTETFSFMDCSPWNDTKYSVVELCELGGCLSVIKSKWKENGVFKAELWVMNEYGKIESWDKLFRNHIRRLGYRSCLIPLVSSKDRSKVMMQMERRWIEWYDWESNDVKKFKIHGLPNRFFRAGVFMGSLVSFADNTENDLSEAVIIGSGAEYITS